MAMKRIAVILVLALILPLFVACAGKDSVAGSVLQGAVSSESETDIFSESTGGESEASGQETTGTIDEGADTSATALTMSSVQETVSTEETESAADTMSSAHESLTEAESDTESSTAQETDTDIDTETETESESKTEAPPETDNAEQELFRELFDINSTVYIAVDIAPEELAKLQADLDHYNAISSKSPIYRMATVTVTVNGRSYVLEEVGIRLKGGDYTRKDFYSAERGIYAANHYSLSFDETFDDEELYGSDAKVWESELDRVLRKARTFATLDGLDLKWNLCYDNTFVREIYVMAFFRDVGVPAQYATAAALSIGGKGMGVYTLYEPIDSHFIEKRFDVSQGFGDLYKVRKNTGNMTVTEDYGIEDYSVGRIPTYCLKTNKKKSDYSRLLSLFGAVNTDMPNKTTLEQAVDIDAFLTFAAASYLAGNPDDYRNNNKNYYIYFTADGRAVLIPNDYDHCLGINYGWNPTGTGMTGVSPFDTTRAGKNLPQANPLICKTVMEGGQYLEEYSRRILAMLDSKWFADDSLYRSYYETVRSHYEHCVVPEVALDNVNNDRMYFSYTRGEYTSGNSENLRIPDYMARIRDTALAAICEKGFAD